MFTHIRQLGYQLTLVSIALGLAPQLASAGILRRVVRAGVSHAAKAKAPLSIAGHGMATRVGSSLASHTPSLSNFAQSAGSALSQHAGDLSRPALTSRLNQISSAAQTTLGQKLTGGSPSGLVHALQTAAGQNVGNNLGNLAPNGVANLLQAVTGQNPAGTAVANAVNNAVGAAGNAAANAAANVAANATPNTPPIINVNLPSLGGGFGGFGPFGRFGGGYSGYSGGYSSQPATAMVADATPTTADVTPASYTAPVDTTATSPTTTPTATPVSSPASGSTSGSADLVVEDIHLAEPATLIAGPAYRVKFRNQGMVAAGPFRVGLYAVLDNTLTGSQAIVDVGGLAAGQTSEIVLRLPQSALRLAAANGSSPGFNRLAIALDSDQAVNETDRGNNEAIVDRAAVEAAH